MLDRINEAELRASEAESRARAAVEQVGEPLPELDTEAVLGSAESAAPGSYGEPPGAPPAPPAPAPDPQISINAASFEQLRALGFSVTQAGRLLAHRERSGGFGSLDQLEQVPGLPPELLAQVRSRLTL
jgi:competence protein ComEA